MELMSNPVRPYAWGSPSAIPDLLGRRPDGSPQAELWMGAHADSPSLLLDGGEGRKLDRAVAMDPPAMLGPVRDRFGDRLPFLLKVLAADAPLSLQVHPSPAQASAGYAREEAAGVARNAPHRNYRDPHHKPEMILALTSFEALCGFRDPGETAAMLHGLGIPGLEGVTRALSAGPADAGLRSAVTMLLSGGRGSGVASALVPACAERLAAGSEFPSLDLTVVELGAVYPGDPGIVVAALLNRVTLEPGQALYLPAGNVHAYLHGVGIEVMAGSDNVLRGGLTPKHVDVPELLSTIDFSPQPLPYVVPDTNGNVKTWRTPAEEFQLSRVLVAGASTTMPGGGPRIALCTEGAVRLEARGRVLELPRGASSFVPAADGAVGVCGEGVLFVAGVRSGP